MPRLIWMLGAVAGGYLGWYLGSKIGIMAAYGISVVGAALGVYVAFKLWQRYFS